MQAHITIQELFPIVLSLEIWGSLLSCKKILFKSDNAAVVAIINKQSAKCSLTMFLVRRLVVAALKFNILFKAQHVSGTSNVVPDRLSRFKFQEARQLAPWLAPNPTQIPEHLLCLN